MPDPSPFVPASTLPGLLEHPDGSPWEGPYQWRYVDGGSMRYIDCRRPEARDQGARVIARWLGVPVGATAPTFRRSGAYEWRLSGEADHGQQAGIQRIQDHCRAFVRESPDKYIRDRFPGFFVVVPSLASIPLGSPDLDALALAAVVRWLGDEVREGRIQPPEVTRAP